MTIRGGLPFCESCNRQVWYRRDYCRACGHRFATYGPPPAEAARQSAWQRHLEEEDRRLRELKSGPGIEPGPWVWYQVLPEWAQAIILGVAFAVLPTIILVVILSRT